MPTYLTDTARRIFEDNSREYGNGLQKFEPNDLNKGKMLDLSKLSEQSKRKIEELYHTYTENDVKKLVGEIDDLLITNYT